LKTTEQWLDKAFDIICRCNRHQFYTYNLPTYKTATFSSWKWSISTITHKHKFPHCPRDPDPHHFFNPIRGPDQVFPGWKWWTHLAGSLTL